MSDGERSRARVESAAGLGFEPRLTDSESACRPLADPAKYSLILPNLTQIYYLETGKVLCYL